MKKHAILPRLVIPLIPVAVTLALVIEQDETESRSPREDGSGSTSRAAPSPPASNPPLAASLKDVPDPLVERRRWKAYLKKLPKLQSHQNSLLALAERLPLEVFASLSPALQQRLARFADQRLDPNGVPSTLCWAPGVEPEVLAAFHAAEELESASPGGLSKATQFDDSDRWDRTATYNSFSERGEQGLPTILTWSFIPDGTSIHGYVGEPTSDSDLIAFLDDRYNVVGGGSDLTTRPWFEVFEASFGNIAGVTGISYVYEPNDDGAALTSVSLPSGSIGRRGDIRIGGHFIDGQSGSNTLAYNFFPNAGEMIIDTSNPGFYGNLTSDSLNLTNVVEHEAGHGLGLGHVCPINQTKLMEPFISRNFRGLQLDDTFSLNRLYGDFYEKQDPDRNNDSSGKASLLPVIPGIPFERERLSIDDNSDRDFYQFDAIAAGDLLTCRVLPATTPPGFVEGPQEAGGSCSSGSPFDFTSVHDLAISLLAADGSTVLATANSQPAGQNEEIIAFEAPSTGTYFLRVEGDATDSTQLYTLQVEIIAPPAAPSELLADTSTNEAVTLTWNDNSDNETAFQIERKIESDGTWAVYALTAAEVTSYTDADPVPGANLFYRVTSLGEAADSAPTATEVTMVVNLSSDSYLYDFGSSTSPLAAEAFRVSPQTDGDVSWSGPVGARDRGGFDPFNRDYLFAADLQTWTHRLNNGVWRVTVRQGDEASALDDLAISAEGGLQAENISSAAGQFIETSFVVEVSDDALDLAFDDLGGATDQWAVNRIALQRLSPYRSWAFREALPEAFDDPGQDADGDTILNLQEYYFGFAPLQPTETIGIQAEPSPDGTSLIFSFTRDPGASPDAVTFESSPDLKIWTPFTPGPDEIATSMNDEDPGLQDVTLTLPISQDQRFIRVGLEVVE